MENFLALADQWHKHESRNLSFALWCVHDLNSRGGVIPNMQRMEIEQQVIEAGRKKKAIPVSVAELTEVAFAQRAEVELRVRRSRSGAHTDVLLNPNQLLAEQLIELFSGSWVGSDPTQINMLSDPEISFETLFRIAIRANYVLTVRLRYDNKLIPSTRFNHDHPDMYDDYERN